MKNNEQEIKDFAETLTQGMTDDELLLAVLKGQIAGTITRGRIRKGWTQKQLAEAMNVSQSQVSHLESGDTNYTLGTLVKISMVLDMDMQCPIQLKDKEQHESKVVPIPTNWKNVQKSATTSDFTGETECPWASAGSTGIRFFNAMEG